MKRSTSGVAVSVLVALATASAADTPASSARSAIFEHRETGFRFPTLLGPFRRVETRRYDRNGRDVGVGYNLETSGHQMAVTVFVYPAPSLPAYRSPEASSTAREERCDRAFAAVQADIGAAHPGARLEEEGIAPSPSAEHAREGLRAVYAFDGVFNGRRQSLRSEATLFCYVGGDWLIAYRTTAPISVDYRADLARLMRDLVWPVTSGAP